jgi:hypothetical protein
MKSIEKKKETELEFERAKVRAKEQAERITQVVI